MANPISKDEIYAAADSLASYDIMPTIKAIRQELGNRGSESTILKHLQDWRIDLLKQYTNLKVRADTLQLENNSLQITIKSMADEIAVLLNPRSLRGKTSKTHTNPLFPGKECY